MVYGALVEFAGFTCPLTLLENDLRQRAGEAGYRGGFIAHYLVMVIYPPGLTRGMQIGLGVVVLLVAITGYWGFLRRYARGQTWRKHWPMGARQDSGDGQVHKRACDRSRQRGCRSRLAAPVDYRVPVRHHDRVAPDWPAGIGLGSAGSRVLIQAQIGSWLP